MILTRTVRPGGPFPHPRERDRQALERTAGRIRTQGRCLRGTVTQNLSLGRLLDVLDGRLNLLVELLVAVPDAVQIRAETDCELRGPTGFPDLILIHSKERQLRPVEEGSILTVHGCRRAKGNQHFVARRDRRVALQPA